MIKIAYFVLSLAMLVTVTQYIPVLNVFSSSWYYIALGVLCVSAFVSFFLTIFNVLGYIEDSDDSESDFTQLYLRYLGDAQYLSKWPLYLWLVLVAVLVQTNMLVLALLVLLTTIGGFSIVIVNNALYTKLLLRDVKGD